MKLPICFLFGFLLLMGVLSPVFGDNQPQNTLLAPGAQTAYDFKVTTLNTEWLSCSENAPNDDKLQVKNIAALISAINPDIIALQEVGTSSSYATIDTLINKLGSQWAGNIIPWSSSNCSQNQGIIYKKSKVQLVSSSLITNGGSSYNWSSGRYPALYNVLFLIGNTNVAISLVNVHAKAMSDESSYSRRKGASESLKTLLDGNSYNSKRIILLGDFNDYLNGTQCADCSPANSPYKNFIDDAVNYKGLTSGLYDSDYNSPVIDNIIISDELFGNYQSNSVIREKQATQTIANYTTTTTDHIPVSAIFRFTITSTETPSQQQMDVSVYPKFSNKYVYIKSVNPVSRISVIDLSGRELIASKTVEKIDISKLPQGVYVVAVGMESGCVIRQKVIKY